MKQLRQLTKGPCGTLRWWLRGLLASMALSSTPGYAADAPAPGVGHFPGTFTLHEETLAVQVAALPLGQVMAEFSRVSGARVLWLTSGAEEPVSVEFPALPLSEALERLLGERNFLLFYSTAGKSMRLTQIWISAREQSPGRLRPEHQSELIGTPLPPPVRQPDPPRWGDRRDSQTARDTESLRAHGGTITPSGSGSQEDSQMELISSQQDHSDSSLQGQEAVAAPGLLGGSASSAAGVPAQCVPDTSATYFADVTGDGRADAIAVNADKLIIRRASPTGFLLDELWTTEPFAGSQGTYFADVTGDGQADAIAVTAGNITVRPSTGTDFLSPQSWITDPSYGDRSPLCRN
jgi:hypothetical protein